MILFFMSLGLKCLNDHFSAVFKRGDVLKIIRKTADGWWLAQDTKGNRGVIPKNYLKVAAQHSFKHVCEKTF